MHICYRCLHRELELGPFIQAETTVNFYRMHFALSDQKLKSKKKREQNCLGEISGRRENF
jgi:hypothetical protein